MADRTMTITNNCDYTVWPAIFTSIGSPGAAPDHDTGWEAPPGTSVSFTLAEGWEGRLWGRTDCDFSGDMVSSPLSCKTGGCNGGLKCASVGGTGVPPCTVAELALTTVQGDARVDYYDVSAVDGTNLELDMDNSCLFFNNPDRIVSTWEPILFVPSMTSSSAKDLNANCPSNLQTKNEQGKVVGCMSDCAASGSPGNPQYCCTGGYNVPETCPKSGIPHYDYFKTIFAIFSLRNLAENILGIIKLNRCTQGYVYAYDDKNEVGIISLILRTWMHWTNTLHSPYNGFLSRKQALFRRELKYSHKNNSTANSHKDNSTTLGINDDAGDENFSQFQELRLRGRFELKLGREFHKDVDQIERSSATSSSDSSSSGSSTSSSTAAADSSGQILGMDSTTAQMVGIAVLAIILVAVVGGGIWWWTNQKKKAAAAAAAEKGEWFASTCPPIALANGTKSRSDSSASSDDGGKKKKKSSSGSGSSSSDSDKSDTALKSHKKKHKKKKDDSDTDTDTAKELGLPLFGSERGRRSRAVNVLGATGMARTSDMAYSSLNSNGRIRVMGSSQVGQSSIGDDDWGWDGLSDEDLEKGGARTGMGVRASAGVSDRIGGGGF
ncbi:Osmotin, thaumatin-like protein [Meredithblackwellia eburnea MCA 4105]